MRKSVAKTLAIVVIAFSTVLAMIKNFSGKRLHYRTREELFDAKLDLIYRCH